MGSGCSGTIPVTFNSVDGYGAGASGLIYLQKIKLSGVYAAGVFTDWFGILGDGRGVFCGFFKS
jgi:hypothetical protein